MTSGLDVLHCLVDTILACLNYFVGVLLMPPVILLHPSVRLLHGGELTQARGNTEEIQSGAGLRHLRSDQRL